MAMNSVVASNEAARVALTRMGDNGPNDALDTALQEAVTVAYGRAYVKMEPLGVIPAKWHKFEPERQKVHNFLTRHRHSQVAHAQFRIEGILINPPGAKRTDGYYQSTEGFGFEVVSHWMTTKDAGLVIEHTQSLAQEMHAEIALEISRLFGSDNTLAEPFELITEEDVEQIEREAKQAKALIRKNQPPKP